jgi:hypothetical protein
MNHYLSTLHGSSWSGAGTTVVGFAVGDDVSQYTGVAIALASAVLTAALTLYSKIRDEQRRQEMLDFEARLKMRQESLASGPANSLQTK